MEHVEYGNVGESGVPQSGLSVADGHLQPPRRILQVHPIECRNPAQDKIVFIRVKTDANSMHIDCNTVQLRERYNHAGPSEHFR